MHKLDAKVIIFDFDGTLADTWKLRFDSWNDACRTHNIVPDDGLLMTLMRQGANDETIAIALCGLDASKQSVLLETRNRLRNRYIDQITLFPDVATSLARFVSAGVHLALCSGTPHDVMRRVLARLGLLEKFRIVQGGDTVEYQKPDPRVLGSILDTLSIEPEEAVFVGDTDADKETSSAANVRFLGIIRHSAVADLRDTPTIESLEQLEVSSTRNDEGAAAREDDVSKSLWDILVSLPPPIPIIVKLFRHFGWAGLICFLCGVVLTMFGSSSLSGKLNFWRHETTTIWRFTGANVYIVYSAKAVVRKLHFPTEAPIEDGTSQGVVLSGATEACLLLARAMSPGDMARARTKAGNLYPDDFETGDVILLGGPIANEAFTSVRDKLAEVKHELPFDFTEAVYDCAKARDQSPCRLPRGIVRRSSKLAEWTTTYDTLSVGAPTVRVDYGMFVMGPNPFNVATRVIVIAGCHREGTLAVTKYLTDPKSQEDVESIVRIATAEKPYVAGIVKHEKSGTYERVSVENF